MKKYTFFLKGTKVIGYQATMKELKEFEEYYRKEGYKHKSVVIM